MNRWQDKLGQQLNYGDVVWFSIPFSYDSHCNIMGKIILPDGMLDETVCCIKFCRGRCLRYPWMVEKATDEEAMLWMLES